MIRNMHRRIYLPTTSSHFLSFRLYTHEEIGEKRQSEWKNWVIEEEMSHQNRTKKDAYGAITFCWRSDEKVLLHKLRLFNDTVILLMHRIISVDRNINFECRKLRFLIWTNWFLIFMYTHSFRKAKNSVTFKKLKKIQAVIKIISRKTDWKPIIKRQI